MICYYTLHMMLLRLLYNIFFVKNIRIYPSQYTNTNATRRSSHSVRELQVKDLSSRLCHTHSLI